MRLFLVLVLLMCFSNFWIYQIFRVNFILGVALILETVLLFFLQLEKGSKYVHLLLAVIFIGLSVYLLTGHFDKGLFTVSTQDLIRTLKRAQYYNLELGRIYGNKLGLFYFNNAEEVFSKASNNLFAGLDLKDYFSKKFPLFFSPFFVIGFLTILKKPGKITFIYLVSALLVSSLINADDFLHSVLMFPVITVCLAIGFIALAKTVKNLNL